MKKLLMLWTSMKATAEDVDKLARLVKEMAPGGEITVIQLTEGWHGIAGNAAGKEAFHKLKLQHGIKDGEVSNA